MSALIIAKWAHVLSVVGVLGGLLLIQLGLPSATRGEPAIAQRLSRFLNALLLMGLLAGAALYGMGHGHQMGAHYNSVIGFKFVVLLAVGGLLPLSRRPGRGDTARWLAIVLMAAAALAAYTL